MNKLPNKLARLRKHYNYSQAQVAEVLGIDAVDYMAFENGSAVEAFAAEGENLLEVARKTNGIVFQFIKRWPP